MRLVSYRGDETTGAGVVEDGVVHALGVGLSLREALAHGAVGPDFVNGPDQHQGRNVVATTSGIVGLGHTGVWVNDLEAMRAFYVDVLGLVITDQDLDKGIVFLSSAPEREHHEMVLQRGRVGGPDTKTLNQISWRLDSLNALQHFDRLLTERNVPVQQRVTHGNALGIYFFDPEGNRLEVYWPTGEAVPQPFRKSIEFDAPATEVLAASRCLVTEGGDTYQPVVS